MVAIIIPIYKPEMTECEKISYRQLLSVLGKYDIYVVAPDHLELPQEISIDRIKVENFNRKYFESVETYNELMLSTEFYERFLGYEYILIYQLDAFVFCDKLMYFCDLGYDYIGAPWISGVSEYVNLGRRVLYVGNGGFSLRKVKSCLNVIKSKKKEYAIYHNRNEDIFFSACDGEDFRVAPIKVAFEFAFEREVRKCLKQNQNRLPFGCHAWERYDLNFVKTFIEKYGYELDECTVNIGNEDEINKEEYEWMCRNARMLEDDSLFWSRADKIHEIFNDSDCEVYMLWGAGYVGKYVCRFLTDIGVKILGIIDSDSEKHGKDIDGYTIYSPGNCKGINKIIVTTEKRYYDEIRKRLEKDNLVYRKNFIFFEDILPERGC